MSTIAELETDLRAAIEVLPSTPIRTTSDHNDSQGQVLTPDQWYYRLRLTVLEEVALDSNLQTVTVQAEIDLLVNMAGNAPNPRDESSYVGVIGIDQTALVDPDFYLVLASVLDVPTETVPQVVEGIERNGNVLIHQIAANLVLQP